MSDLERLLACCDGLREAIVPLASSNVNVEAIVLCADLRRDLVAAGASEELVRNADALEVEVMLLDRSDKTGEALALVDSIRSDLEAELSFDVDSATVDEVLAWLVARRLKKYEGLGRKMKTAASLGIERSTLDRWIKKYDL